MTTDVHDVGISIGADIARGALRGLRVAAEIGVASLFLGSIALAQPVAGADPMAKVTQDAKVASAPNRYEGQAIEVVKKFTAAYEKKDAATMAALVEEDVKFRGDPSDPDLRKGRDTLVKFFAPPSGTVVPTSPPGMPAMQVEMGRMKITQSVAIGGPKEVTVLTRRIDYFKINGKEMAIPVSTFFRVNATNGKIAELFEVPLLQLPGMSGPPPAGPPPAGAPPR